MNRDGNRPSRVPKRVRRDDLNDALAPLMDLLGTDVNRVYDEPGIVVTDGEIRLTLAGRVRTGAAARDVTVGEGEYAESGTQVRVRIVP